MIIDVFFIFQVHHIDDGPDLVVGWESEAGFVSPFPYWYGRHPVSGTLSARGIFLFGEYQKRMVS